MSSTSYFICAPTATGKSAFAIRLAKKINGVIINSDSMQVYSNLEVLTARPSKNDHKKVKHLLYGYVKAQERYNVSKWCNDVSKIINTFQKKNIPLVIVGGTGMYVNSLINGIFEIPTVDEKFKKESNDLLIKIGLENFIKEVSSFDSDSLKNISLNDTLRIRRIWEVYNATGKSYSYFKEKKNKKFLKKFDYKIFLFKPPRDKIYLNVNKRFENMLNNGAIEEVKELVNLNLNKSMPIMRAHGVPEISSYLNNKCTLKECIEKGQQVTRNYVKRQLTWWRSSTLPLDRVFNEFPEHIDENLKKI